MSSVKENRLVIARAKQNQPFTDNTIISSVKSSNSLLRQFKEKCHESVSARVNAAEEVLFHLLGNRHIFSPRGKTFGKDIEQQRIEVIDEAYRKLLKLKPSRHVDSEWWRTAELSNLCSKHTPECDERHQT